MEKVPLNKVDRSKAALKTEFAEESDFIKAPAQSLIDFAWELTAELYSLKGVDVESRLQRNVAKLIRQ